MMATRALGRGRTAAAAGDEHTVGQFGAPDAHVRGATTGRTVADGVAAVTATVEASDRRTVLADVHVRAGATDDDGDRVAGRHQQRCRSSAARAAWSDVEVEVTAACPVDVEHRLGDTRGDGPGLRPCRVFEREGWGRYLRLHLWRRHHHGRHRHRDGRHDQGGATQPRPLLTGRRGAEHAGAS